MFQPYAEVSISDDGKTLNRYKTTHGILFKISSEINIDNRLRMSQEDIKSAEHVMALAKFYRENNIGNYLQSRQNPINENI